VTEVATDRRGDYADSSGRRHAVAASCHDAHCREPTSLRATVGVPMTADARLPLSLKSMPSDAAPDVAATPPRCDEERPRRRGVTAPPTAPPTLYQQLMQLTPLTPLTVTTA
jgi:hypothetical protein